MKVEIAKQIILNNYKGETFSSTESFKVLKRLKYRCFCRI